MRLFPIRQHNVLDEVLTGAAASASAGGTEWGGAPMRLEAA